VREVQALFTLTAERSLDARRKTVDDVARSSLEKQRNLKAERNTVSRWLANKELS
jgi:hypothetical protein